MLGAQQHGFIDSVGFDLYSQMFKEAIEERKGDLHKQPESRALKLILKSMPIFRMTYIMDGHQKIEMYKRFRSLSSLPEIEELEEEILDRFGEYPEEVGYLFLISEMKVYAKNTKLESIKQDKKTVNIFMSQEGTAQIDGSKVFNLCNKHGRAVGLGMEGSKLKISINTSDWKRPNGLTWRMTSSSIWMKH